MAFKIFPATINNEGQKVPLIKGWYENASSDPAQHAQWGQQFGQHLKMWGVPTGSLNGIFALDIDVKKVNGWDALKGLEIPNTMFQDTPSGGKHLIFKAKEGVHYPNSVNSKLGLDTRGDRGWIAFYGFKNDTVIADIPDSILSLVAKRDTQVTKTPQNVIKIAASIAHDSLTASLDAIRNAPEGESNNVLNTESFKVGQLVLAGSYTREYAETELFKAAKDRGKPDYESRATIESGLNGGLKSPIINPFGDAAPVIHFPLPIPTVEPNARWTPKFLTKYDLLNTSKLRKPQLFQDWSTEDIQITTADGGTGKTTLKLYEAICLALGDRFLGFDCKQRGKTLFITGEDTDKKLAAMLGAILRQMGLFDEAIGNEEKIQCVLESIVIKKDDDLCLIAKDKQGFLYPNPSAMEKVLHAVDDIKPKMIVFDPIASFWGSESALNDMNKVVTKFMARLAEQGICVEMINHMGKSSSANKDMSQFAGRGGSGLPSNSRVSRVLRALTPEEFKDMTGTELIGDQSAILCNVNKFSDGSVLFNKPFVIVRDAYLFKRITLTTGKVKELEQKMSDVERIFEFVKEEREAGRYPTEAVVINHFKNNGNPIAKVNTAAAISTIQYQGYIGEKFRLVPNPDISVGGKAIVITDMEGKEL